MQENIGLLLYREVPINIETVKKYNSYKFCQKDRKVWMFDTMLFQKGKPDSI